MTIILCDVDGCVLDWSKDFEKWATITKGYSPEKSLQDEYRIEDWLGISLAEAHSLMQEFSVSQKDFESLDCYPDAKLVIDRLHQEGYRFVFVTAVSNDDITYTKRMANLTKHFGNTFQELHHVGIGAPKLETLKTFEPTIWIEDSIKHAIEGREANHTPILINRRHNRNQVAPEFITRVDDWNDIYRLIKLNETNKLLF